MQDDTPDGESGLYERLRAAVQAEEPVALATVIDGPGTGAKLVVTLDGDAHGSLGNEDLDRVVQRDARGELAAGAPGYGTTANTARLARRPCRCSSSRSPRLHGW